MVVANSSPDASEKCDHVGDNRPMHRPRTHIGSSSATIFARHASRASASSSAASARAQHAGSTCSRTSHVKKRYARNASTADESDDSTWHCPVMTAASEARIERKTASSGDTMSKPHSARLPASLKRGERSNMSMAPGPSCPRVSLQP